MAAEEVSPLISAPNEVLEQYLLSLDPKSLQNACRSHRTFTDICRDDYFWKNEGRSGLRRRC